MKELAKKVIRTLLAQRGLAITRVDAISNKSSLGYISASKTVSAAKNDRLSICDYLERLWQKQGDTQRVIEQMASAGVFEMKDATVLEIGTGTGRYLEKLLERGVPARYESYETARDWAEYLESEYPIVSHDADGISLKQTPTHSVDLIHAHGVFVYLPFLTSYRYWEEIWRVAKTGGFVVFDIISEDCLDELTVEKWLASEHNYPCFLSKDYVVSVFKEHGFLLLKTFTNRYGEGLSEYLAFVRNDSAQQGHPADTKPRGGNAAVSS